MNKKLSALFAVLLVAVIYLEGGLEFVEHALMDLRSDVLASQPGEKVVVVAIDPETLEALKISPLPRSYHATVLRNLVQAGAQRVAFDFDFSAHSPAKDDTAFAEALVAAEGRAILPVLRQKLGSSDSGTHWLEAPPLEMFAEAATLAGVGIAPGVDGLVRRYGDGVQDERPSMARALAGSMRPRNPFYIDFSMDAGAIPKISYLDVLTGQFDRSLVRHRAVVVGSTAVQSGEHLATPAGPLPTPILQALAYESIAAGRELHRVPAGASLVAALILTLLAAQRLDAWSWRQGLLFLAAAAGGCFGLSLLLQATAPVLLDVSPVVASLATAYGFAQVRRIDRQRLGLSAQAAKVRKTEIMTRHVVQNSSEAIITVDGMGHIETFNPAAEKLFGFRLMEVQRRPIADLIAGGLAAAEDRVGRTEFGPVQSVGYRNDSSTFQLEMAVTRFTLEGRRVRVAFLRDITERKVQEAALEHQATHDVLTELPNRMLLQQRAQAMLEQARNDDGTAAVLVLDLDRFKEVNDTLGHKVGDLLLQRIARRLEKPLRPEDTIARIGGDEFAVLLPQGGAEAAQAMARLLVAALKKPLQLEGLALQVDVAIGIALYPEHGTDAATLLQHGDVAMYVAKRGRTSIAYYDPQQDLNTVRHLTLRGELQRAVDEDHLVLYYQPKIHAGVQKVAGVEALIRWNHPEHGMVFPDEFIPLAENTGLIRPVTRWVLESAIRQGVAWQEEGSPLSIAVNCSARNLMEDDLPEAIDGLLKKYGLPAERLTLEVTETSLIEDPERALEVATLLTEQGIRISIDDFGTGYSSLNYLKKLPAKELKIDRSFVMNMDQDKGDAMLVLSIIDLAHNLGLQAVAEGVETQAVWERIRALGCDIGQGYYFARPMPVEALNEWLQTSVWAGAERTETVESAGESVHS